MLKPLWITGMPGALFDKVTHFCGKTPEALTEKVSEIQLRLDREVRGENCELITAPINLADEVAALLPQGSGGRKKADTKFFFAEASLAWTHESWDACLSGSYLLFFQSPLSVLRNLRGQTDAADPGEELRLAMATWLAYHEKFLNIYHAHPKKALLLRLDGTTTESIAALRKKLEGSKSFAKGILPETFFACLLNEESDSGQDTASDEAFLSGLLAQAYPECHQLFMTLEAAALAVSPKYGEPSEPDLQSLSLKALEQQLSLNRLAIDAQAAAQQLQAAEERLDGTLSDLLEAQRSSEALLLEQQETIAQREALAKEKEQCLSDKKAQFELLKKRDQQLIDVKSELEVALLQLHQLQESHEAEVLSHEGAVEQLALLEKEKNRLFAENTVQAAALKEHESRMLELQNESGLMLLQLHQVQEECEAQFLAQKTLAEKLGQTEKENVLLLADKKRQADLLVKTDAQIVELEKGRDALQSQLHKAQKDAEAHLLTQKKLAEKLELTEKEKALLLADKKRQADLLVKAEAQIVELGHGWDALQSQLHRAQKDAEAHLLAEKKLAGKLELADKEISLQRVEQKHQLARLAEKETRIVELQSDSELMLLQLHQVQEELENYFLECERARLLLESYRQSERKTRQLLTQLMKPHL